MLKRVSVIVIGLLILSMAMVAGCGSKVKVGGPGAESAVTTNDGKDLDKMMAEIKGLPGYSCEMVMTGGEPILVKSKLWASGTKTRMETEVNGIKNIMIVDAKGEVWSYMPTENLAMKMPTAPQTTLPTDWANNDEKPQIVGYEKVDGYDCVIMSSPSDQTAKCWVMKDRGLPVKIQSTVNGQKALIEYKNYNISQQADELFTVPAGAKVMAIPGTN